MVLHVRLTKIRAETGHEIRSSDDVDGSFQGLENEFKAPPNLFLTDFTDGANLFESTRNAFLPVKFKIKNKNE